MSDTYYGIDEAIAAAGIPTVEPDETEQAATQPADEQEFTGEDVSQYFADDGTQIAADEPDAAPAQPAMTPEIAGLIQQNQTLLQQAFDTERKQTAARIAELEARLAAADASNTKPTEQEKAWYETLDMPELTDEQKKQYAQSLPIIEAIAARKAVEIARKMETARLDPMAQRLQETVQPLQETVQQQQANLEAQKQSAFQQNLSARLPWLAAAVQTPAYAKYYKEVVPGAGGLTRGTLIQQAEAVGNIDALVDLLSGFKPTNQQQIQQYAAPGRGHTMTPTQQATAAQPGVKKGVKFSTYSNALEAYSNGKMSYERFRQIDDAWSSALINGTAVMD